MLETDRGICLLPNAWQKVGYVLSISGIVFLFLRFGLGIKPSFLEIKVFAIYSSIFESRYFSLVGNNISEEIGLLFLLAGLFLITFSKEKYESEQLWHLRLKSIFFAVFFNSILLIVATLFVFGWGFLAIMAANLFSVLVFYNLFFRYLILIGKRKVI